MAYVSATPAPVSGCFLCEARASTDDRARLVVARRERAFLMLNAYPYVSGHLMAVDGADHFTVLESLADPDGALTQALVKMVAT